MSDYKDLPDLNFPEQSGELRVHETEGLGAFPDAGGQSPRQRQAPRPPRPEEAKDHFQELTDAAALAHEKLSLRKSPYRFCVYRKGEEIFIDIVLLGPDGKIASLTPKNITHEDFRRLLREVENGEGLFFDRTA